MSRRNELCEMRNQDSSLLGGVCEGFGRLVIERKSECAAGIEESGKKSWLWEGT